MVKPLTQRRRSVLKAIGAGLAGSAALTGTASAHGDGGNGRPWGTFTWGDDVLYEMADTDLPALFDGDPPTVESDGNHNAHAPLWLVGSMDDFSGTIAGDEHSPHPNPLGARVDHVVPLGRDFSAQWHVHLVIRPSELDDLKSAADAAANDNFGPLLTFLNNLPHGDGQGKVMTSAATIRAAAARGDRLVIPLFDEEGNPDVFTCPIRPH